MTKRPIKTVKFGLIAFFVVLLGLYAVFETREVLAGPHISVVSPANGSTVEGDLVELHGNAENISFLSLNGKQIFTDKSGTFTEQLLVPEGYTILELKAKDRFNRETRKLIRIVRL